MLLVNNTHSTLVALYGFYTVIHTVILPTGTCYSTSPGHNNISVKQLLCDQNCFMTIKVKRVRNIKPEGRRKINFEFYNLNCALIGNYLGCHMSSWTPRTKKVFYLHPIHNYLQSLASPKLPVAPHEPGQLRLPLALLAPRVLLKQQTP